MTLLQMGCATREGLIAIESKSAPKVMGPYSHAIETKGFVFLSGQLGIDPVTNKAANDIQTQTKQVMDNLNGVLRQAGLGFNSVVKTTIFLKSISDIKQVNEIYASYFKDGVFPARSTIVVSEFQKNFLIEIEMTAQSQKQ